jgi:hypothetical protein
MSDEEQITDDYIQNLINQASEHLQKKENFKEVKEVIPDKPKQKRFLSDEAKERARERLSQARLKAQEIRIMKQEIKNSSKDEDKKTYEEIKNRTQPKQEKKIIRVREEPPQKPPKPEPKIEPKPEPKIEPKIEPKLETVNAVTIPEKKVYYMPHYKYAKRFGFISPL